MKMTNIPSQGLRLSKYTLIKVKLVSGFEGTNIRICNKYDKNNIYRKVVSFFKSYNDYQISCMRLKFNAKVFWFGIFDFLYYCLLHFLLLFSQKLFY